MYVLAQPWCEQVWMMTRRLPQVRRRRGRPPAAADADAAADAAPAAAAAAAAATAADSTGAPPSPRWRDTKHNTRSQLKRWHSRKKNKKNNAIDFKSRAKFHLKSRAKLRAIT